MLAGAPTPKCWEAENYNGSNLKATTRAEGKHLESSGGPGKLRAKLRGLLRQYLQPLRRMYLFSVSEWVRKWVSKLLPSKLLFWADRQEPLPMFRCPGLPGFP